MRITFIIFSLLVYSMLFAQKEEKRVIVKDVSTIVDKESNATEKAVSIDVDVLSDGKRKVRLVTNDGSGDEIIEWEDNGEIPDDVQKILDEESIDINILSVDAGDVEESFEWDGDGEMPEEMKALLESHDIDIEELDEHEGKKKVIVKKRESGNMPHGKKRKMMFIGDQASKCKIKDGKCGQCDKSPEECKDACKKKGLSIEKHKKIIHKGSQSDAYMGAQIESADGGVKILELMKDGPADGAKLRKNDVITSINGARTRDMESLLQLLSYFEPNDKVDVVVKRDGKEKKLSLTLGQRPEHFK